MDPDKVRSTAQLTVPSRPQVEPRSPIGDVIESIEKQQAIILDTINRLGDRIGAVLAGEIEVPNVAGMESADHSGSYLYHRLCSIQEANEALVYRLNRLIDRVEL